MTTTDDFKEELDEIFAFARAKKLAAVVIRAGNLHKLVGGYPGPQHRMPMCCSAMRQARREGDEIISEPPSGQGASLEIIYRFDK